MAYPEGNYALCQTIDGEKVVLAKAKKRDAFSDSCLLRLPGVYVEPPKKTAKEQAEMVERLMKMRRQTALPAVRQAATKAKRAPIAAVRHKKPVVRKATVKSRAKARNA